MEVAIRKMGNSQGVLIPKPILAQLGLEGSADLQVRGVIEIRAIRRNPREGWAEDAQRLAVQGASLTGTLHTLQAVSAPQAVSPNSVHRFLCRPYFDRSAGRVQHNQSEIPRMSKIAKLFINGGS